MKIEKDVAKLGALVMGAIFVTYEYNSASVRVEKQEGPIGGAVRNATSLIPQ